MFLKIFIFLIISTPLFSQSIQDQISALEKKQEQRSYDDVIERGEALKANYRNNLRLSEILIFAYLNKGFFNKAKQELSSLRQWQRGETIIFLEGVILFYEKNYREAEKRFNSVLNNNSQFKDAYWWLAKTFFNQGKINLAESNLNNYQALSGNDLPWFELKGQLLLSQIDRERNNLRVFLSQFQSLYPNSPDFFYLNSQYFLAIKNYRRALNNIDRAIFFNENYFPFLKEKMKIIFLSNNWERLLKYIATLNRNDLEEEKFIYTLESFINLRINQKKTTFFELNNKDQLNKVIKPLEKILILDENAEWTRFFLEEIILANTSVKNSLRKKYAAFHLRQSEQFLALGINQLAVDNLRRGLKLDPLNYQLRENYAAYLRNSARMEDYYEELLILKTINSNSDQNDSFVLDTRIERLKRNIDSLMYSTYNNTFVPKHSISYYIILNNESLAEQFDRPYYEVVLAQMLLEKINQSFLAEAKLIFNQEKKDILSQPNYFKENFFINFKANDEADRFNLNIIISNFEQEAETINIFSSGNEKYQAALDKFFLSINQWTKIHGEIVEVKRNEIIVSLGELSGLKVGDTLIVSERGNQLGELEVVEVENYFSKARPISTPLNSRFDLNRLLKKGYVVERKQTN